MGIGEQSRAEKVLALLREREIDLLLVNNLVNLRWLTGFSGSSGVCLIGRDTRTFFTDFRYVEQVNTEVVGGFELVEVDRDIYRRAARFVPAGSRFGFDDRSLSVSSNEELQQELVDGVEPVKAGGLIEELRSVKEPNEVEAIAAATELADEAFETVITMGLVGKTERDVAWTIESELRKRGATGVSFPPIVASGAQSALPHAEPRDIEIPCDVLVVIDWGCILDGYCSDCTRTVSTGEPDDDTQNVYRTVLEAQVEALKKVKNGVSCQAIDAVARDAISAAGYGAYFGHGTGHGVGLEVHEAPRLAKTSKTDLRTGNVVTVEPGVYLPGQFGVRIEDLVVVEDDGARLMTSIDKTLRVVQ